MTLAIATVADSIAGISVSNLEILDINEIPKKIDARKSYMAGLPNFVTNFSVTRDSFGGGSTAKMTVRYDLNYRLFYKPAGAGRETVIEPFSGLVAMWAAVIDAVLVLDVVAGLIDIIPASVANMGMVNDPSDNVWYGCDIPFTIQEFVN